MLAISRPGCIAKLLAKLVGPRTTNTGKAEAAAPKLRLISKWQAKQAKSPENEEKIGKHANLAAATAAGWNPRLGPWTHLSRNCSKS